MEYYKMIHFYKNFEKTNSKLKKNIYVRTSLKGMDTRFKNVDLKTDT